MASMTKILRETQESLQPYAQLLDQTTPADVGSFLLFWGVLLEERERGHVLLPQNASDSTLLTLVGWWIDVIELDLEPGVDVDALRRLHTFLQAVVDIRRHENGS